MFPFYGTSIGNMELAEIVHGAIAMLFIAIMVAHIYIGTIGMEGAFEGMGEGTVDLNWARQHHQLGRRGRTSSKTSPTALHGDHSRIGKEGAPSSDFVQCSRNRPIKLAGRPVRPDKISCLASSTRPHMFHNNTPTTRSSLR